MAKIVVIIVCCAALSALAEKCPTSSVDQLNITAYTGTWYPVMHMSWPAMNCSSVGYSELNKTALAVTNSSLGPANEYETVEGVAVLGEDQRFYVTMKDNYTQSFYVLATDYGNYTLVTSCDSVKNTGQRALVLGRERNLTEETLEVVKDVVKDKLGLDSLKPVWQSECPSAAPAASLLAPLGLLLVALVTRRFL